MALLGIIEDGLRLFEGPKQIISLEHNSTKKLPVTCSVPQGSRLRPSLFILYVNDLHHALKVLIIPIILADGTNLFFSHSDINVLFEKMNKELTNVSNWFNVNKFQVFFFHKLPKKYNISLQLPNLNLF